MSGGIFVLLFVVLSFAHGFSIGAADDYALDAIRGAANWWHYAFIGDGPGGSRADVVYNPAQFILYVFTAILHLPAKVTIVIQALGVSFGLGYYFARLLADRAQNWVASLSVVVGLFIFLNADFTLSVASGSFLAVQALIFTALVIECAIDIKVRTVRPKLLWLGVLAALSSNLALFMLLPLFYFYFKRIPLSGNEKKVNLQFSYSLGAAALYLVVRLIYFGTLGFFDPIINFQWQISVHGFGALVAGITQALYQMEDAGGLVGLVLLILALFVERQPNLGFMGLALVAMSTIQGLYAVFMPVQEGYVTSFSWLTPLYYVVPAIFIMNPLQQFREGWNTRLFITGLTALIIATMTWPSKAKQYTENPDLAPELESVLSSLDIPTPTVYGNLPDPTGHWGVNWASRQRVTPALRKSPAALAEWFFEIAAPEVVIKDLRFPVDSAVLTDARFSTYYTLVSKGVPAIYVRKEIKDKGEEYQLYWRLKKALDGSNPGNVVPQLVAQEVRAVQMLGGTYHLLPLVRCLQKLVPELEWTNTLEEVGNVMGQTEGGYLNKLLVTASYSARFEVELADEITRYFFINNFTPVPADQRIKMTSVLDPVACLPNAPGFQDGRIKLYLNRNNLMVYLPNAHNVDTLSPFFVKMSNSKLRVVRTLPEVTISDHLVLLGPADGYASFILPGNADISTLEIGQRSASNMTMWSTNFSLERLRNRDNF